jgi:GNAT superfamily N-acetyltransferase
MSTTTSASARYPAELECDALLTDGRVVAIRPIRPDDAPALEDFHEHLSNETIYRRFFHAHPHLRSEEVKRFTNVDYRSRLALVAELDGNLAAVARYDQVGSTDEAEVAFVVTDALQGRGLGTLLLEHLAAAGRRRGLSRFVADTLSSNYPMQEVFRLAGFQREALWSDGVVHVSFPITPTNAYLEALVERHLSSVREWLRPGVNPTGSTGVNGAGVVCRSRQTADAVLRECAGRVHVSTLLVSSELGVDVLCGLAYVATDPNVEVIVVELDDLELPRRGVALARYVTARMPVVGLDREGRFGSECLQAGIVPVSIAGELATSAEQLFNARRSGLWTAFDRGGVAEVPGGDTACARRLLDEWAGLAAAATTGATARARTGTSLLASPETKQLLGAYGVVATSAPISLEPGSPCSTFTVTDEDGGLKARATSAGGPEGRAEARLLPLTDRDVDELVAVVWPARDQPAAVGSTAAGSTAAGSTAAGSTAAGQLAGRDGCADALVRVARLIDDQPDVRAIEITWPDGSWPSAVSASVWIGSPRSTADDPFVRRLPAKPTSRLSQEAD